MVDIPNTIYEQYPTAKWEVEGQSYTFAVVDLEEGRSNRLAKHRRLYRDGARLDDTYADARTWKLTCFFFNYQGQEKGIDGEAQYPDNVNAICDSFDVHETGDLTLPTRGRRRCRAESYSRIETASDRDACKVVFTWVEDNEDDESVAAWTAPSAKSLMAAVSDETLAACTDVGAWNDKLSSLDNLVADLVGMAEAPGQYLSDLDAKASKMCSQLEAIEEAFSTAAEQATTEAETLLLDPEASLAGRRIRELSDVVSRIHSEAATQTGSRIVSRSYKTVLSIFDVATAESQDPSELMALNSALPDMLSIPAGTTVLIYGEA